MHNRAYALMTGIFILVLAVTAAIMGWWLADADPQREPYVILTEESVSGLTDDSRIYYRGVPAGRVASIELDREQPGRIRILINVDREVPITRGTYALIEAQGLTGIARIQLEDSGEDPERLDTDPGDPSVIPVRPTLLSRISRTGEDAFRQFESVIGRLEKLLSDENLDHAGNIMANLDEVSGRLVELESRVGKAVDAVPPLAEDTRSAVRALERTASEFEGIGPRVRTVAEEVETLSRTGRRLGDDLERETIPHLNDTLRRLDDASQDFSRLVRQLERQPDSLLRGRRDLRAGPGEEGYERED